MVHITAPVLSILVWGIQSVAFILLAEEDTKKPHREVTMVLHSVHNYWPAYVSVL